MREASETAGSGGLVSVSGSCLITVVMSEGTSATIVPNFSLARLQGGHKVRILKINSSF